MKKYNISFSSTRFDRKPSGTEIGKISNELSSCSMDYRTIAHYVGECGCTFSPAVFDGSRKKENYCEQQLIGLDFDGGVSYNEIKNIAEYYRIPILFSYKTFSYSKDTEKFRIVFAVSDAITDVLTGETVTAMLMKIFDKCDKACADSSRMFFGGKGLIELADKESEISVRDITFAFVSYMADEYGPTHKLKMEVYNKAVSKGIKIAYTPELLELSSELQNMIMHSYGVGAGEYTISRLNSIFHNMKPDNPDYQILSEYFKSLNSVKNFAGHIVTTHDRLLLMRKNSPVLSGRKVIIDEDIMRTMLSTITVDNNDIFSAVNSKVFPGYAEEKLKSIIRTEGLQRHEYNSDFSIEITDDILKFLEKIDGNIIDLIDSQYTFRNEEKTIFLKRKFLPCSKVIVMSATANPEIYEMLTRYKIHFYPCKEAKYMGKAKLYTKYSFSRYALKNQKDIIKYVMDKTENDTIITVKAFEDEFKTKYHYGAVEGLNCLEGENISVVGLPNIVEEVYKLYGLAAGINSENSSMRPMRTEYKGYNFEINSFDMLIIKVATKDTYRYENRN